jgi:hypothetical protein
MTVHEADGVDAEPVVQLPSGTPPVMQAAAETPKKPAETAPKPSVRSKPVEKASDVVEEPVVRKSADSVSADSNPKLAALMAEWGTDD